MSIRVRSLFVIFPLCLSLTITGCGLQALLGNKNKTSSTQGETKAVIAVSLDEEDPNKLLITKGIDDLAKKENVQVKYLEQSAAGEGSPLKGAKVLIYQGGNPSLLKNAETNKIPVLALSQLPAGVKPVGIITPDQEKVGELMAQTLVGKVAEGQVVILQGDPSDTGFQERLAGNKAVLSKYPKLTVQTIVSSPDSETVAKQGLVDSLQKNSGKVQGILAYTEKLAVLASAVLKEAQADKKISLVGGQASVASLERISSGAQAGDVDTSPYLQGVNAYQWAHKIMNKESLDVNDSITSEQGEIPAKIIQVKAVTPDNLALIQKSYTKTLQSAEQDKKQTEQTDQASKSKDQSKDQGQAEKTNQSGDKTGASSEGQGQQQQDKPSSLPPGVKTVTERIKTETTREYLDAQGKVIGTEKTTNEQVKTVPPEMLKQQSEQSKEDATKDGGDQSAKNEGMGKK
ncbi:ABC-type sugar transport system, periplasmic component [Candidatus Desulfosporosinus infrequens]|uniref:ABC-type sugar transport system, periplasmic component n=1 Tax=Candidatus Desulfosporosinus infrequens TaxID=2043169 RepID=A0A2U3LSE0_9FIRM|nr:ABC-type sugar transport system, periplasmic component [Candidatus Desulfosporosinus infrequens]